GGWRKRWLGRGGAGGARGAIFIDGSSYIYRLSNHIPFNQPLRPSQTPTLFGREVFLQKGLDLQGGTEVVLEIAPRSRPPGAQMENRGKKSGVREAGVQTQGSNRGGGQLPGVDFDRARQLVGRTAKLT